MVDLNKITFQLNPYGLRISEYRETSITTHLNTLSVTCKSPNTVRLCTYYYMFEYFYIKRNTW